MKKVLMFIFGGFVWSLLGFSINISIPVDTNVVKIDLNSKDEKLIIKNKTNKDYVLRLKLLKSNNISLDYSSYNDPFILAGGKEKEFNLLFDDTNNFGNIELLLNYKEVLDILGSWKEVKIYINYVDNKLAKYQHVLDNLARRIVNKGKDYVELILNRIDKMIKIVSKSRSLSDNKKKYYISVLSYLKYKLENWIKDNNKEIVKDNNIVINKSDYYKWYETVVIKGKAKKYIWFGKVIDNIVVPDWVYVKIRDICKHKFITVNGKVEDNGCLQNVLFISNITYSDKKVRIKYKNKDVSLCVDNGWNLVNLKYVPKTFRDNLIKSIVYYSRRDNNKDYISPIRISSLNLNKDYLSKLLSNWNFNFWLYLKGLPDKLCSSNMRLTWKVNNKINNNIAQKNINYNKNISYNKSNNRSNNTISTTTDSRRNINTYNSSRSCYIWLVDNSITKIPLALKKDNAVECLNECEWAVNHNKKRLNRWYVMCKYKNKIIKNRGTRNLRCWYNLSSVWWCLYNKSWKRYAKNWSIVWDKYVWTCKDWLGKQLQCSVPICWPSNLGSKAFGNRVCRKLSTVINVENNIDINAFLYNLRKAPRFSEFGLPWNCNYKYTTKVYDLWKYMTLLKSANWYYYLRNWKKYYVSEDYLKTNGLKYFPWDEWLKIYNEKLKYRLALPWDIFKRVKIYYYCY